MERHVPSPSQEGGETPDEGMSPAEENPGEGGLDCHGLCRQTLQANVYLFIYFYKDSTQNELFWTIIFYSGNS